MHVAGKVTVARRAAARLKCILLPRSHSTPARCRAGLASLTWLCCAGMRRGAQGGGDDGFQGAGVAGGHMGGSGQMSNQHMGSGGQMGGSHMGHAGGGGGPGQIDVNNPMFMAAAGAGAQFFDQGHSMLQKNVEQYVSMNLLRHYFSVDTLYVATKLKVLVIPFTHKNWQQTKDPTSTTGRSAPRVDVNSPDLYIPVMSLVTYIVLVGLQMGWTHTFTPEVLSKTASSGLTVMVLEVLLLKLGFYLLEGPPVSFIDFVCYSGYKYVTIVASTLAHIMLGRAVYYVVLLGMGASMSFFMLKAVAAAIIPAGPDNFQSPQRNVAKEYFVLAIAGLQIPVCWFMGI